MKKILFISHNATLTGAPILLLRLITLFKSITNTEVSILLNQGGEIKNRFEELSSTMEWSINLQETFCERFKIKACSIIGIKCLSKIEKHRNTILDTVNNVDYIFNNTIANVQLLRRIPTVNKKIISYIHELNVGCKIDSTVSDMNYINEISNIIFVPSNAVKSFLEEEYKFESSKIKILKYVFPNIEFSSTQNETIIESNSSSIVVGICGTLDWRKGYDILPFIVKGIAENHADMHIQFEWIGADLTSKEYLILQNDLLKLGIIDRVSFISKRNDIQAYLGKIDILLLLSREDAFPLVVLEAAQYGIPCIYFSDAGGIAEFCSSDAGIPINYLDVDSMISAIAILSSNRIERERFGKNAKTKFLKYKENSQLLQPLIDFINE